MSSVLDYTGDALTVKLGGMESEDFAHALNVVRSIPGRRFNGETKDWEFVADYMTAQKILNLLAPVPSPAARAWLRQARTEAADAVRTTLPDDAELLLPWASDLYAYQRADVAFMATHGLVIDANDMGLGKTVEAICTVQEYELRNTQVQPVPETEASGKILRGRQDDAGRAVSVQDVHAGVDAPASRGGPSDSARSAEQALRGLRNTATPGGDGLGSRQWEVRAEHQRAPIWVRQHSRLPGDVGARAGEVSSAVPQLSSLEAPVLVICPNAMRDTWREEIEKWDGAPVTLIDGRTPDARRKQVRSARGWVVVNWEKLRLMPELAAVKWGAVIADEAHRAKNRKAKQTRALWKLDAPLKLALTGTPIQNSPDELYAPLKWLYPKTYSSYWRFYEEYCEYVELNFGPRRGRLITGVKNVDKLRFELADKLVRRTKKEALPDLPEKLPPQIILVPMKPKQRRLYEEVEEQLWVQVAQAAAAGEPAALAAVEHHSLLLLPNAAARTVRLRQVASTPALLGAADDSAKLDGIVEYISDMDPDSKAIVFTEFTGTADILVERLDRRKISAAAYHGKVTAGARNELKHSFQDEPDPRVLVCTPETGGVGLTLTRANVAILCEEDWVPANDDQAVDRLHRIGQDKEVHVIVFRCADSVETERVAPTSARKRRIVGAVIKQD
jgi:SNF2 family DNA or RNA helicase